MVVIVHINSWMLIRKALFSLNVSLIVRSSLSPVNIASDFIFRPNNYLMFSSIVIFATGLSTLQPIQQPRRSWMGCWSQTLPRCTWCRLGWQVITPLSPSPFCRSVALCYTCLLVCLSVCLGSTNHWWVLWKNILRNYFVCLHQTNVIYLYLLIYVPPHPLVSIYMCGMFRSSQI